MVFSGYLVFARPRAPGDHHGCARREHRSTSETTNGCLCGNQCRQPRQPGPHAFGRAPALCPCLRQLLARIDAELSQQFANVPFRALERNAEHLGDLAIGVPALDQSQDFALPIRQADLPLCPFHTGIMHPDGQVCP